MGMGFGFGLPQQAVYEYIVHNVPCVQETNVAHFGGILPHDVSQTAVCAGNTKKNTHI